MIAIDDGLVNANLNMADVFFVIATLLFVVYAFVGFARNVDARIHAVLLGLGLACVSFAWFVL